MAGLDAGTLMALMAADPAERQAQVQRLLVQHLGGGSSGAGLAAALANGNGTPPPPAHDDGPPAELRGLYREAAALAAELRRATGIVGDVADALGACARCLGTDERCPVCLGRGVPGSKEPDAPRFDQLVAPAVRRLAGERQDLAPEREEHPR
jgi:hypothetical protein